MKDCLKQFMNTGLFEASLSLLDKLGIRYTKGSAQSIDARQISSDKLSKAADAALDLVTDTYFVAQIDDRTFQQHPNKVTLDAALNDAGEEKYKGLFVFAVEVKPDANVTRTVAATLTRVFNRIAKAQPVILFIRQGHELSLSTCERSEYTQQWRSGEKLGKVSILRNINCCDAHRGHIDLLSRMSGGAINFDELYKNWMEIFDVKLLSKQFYNELFGWYEWVMQLVQQGEVCFPAYPKDGYGKESKDETIIRIITRMLFVWFIKEKGLIPKELFDTNQINLLVKDFDSNSFTTHNYYNAILQNLFFATLNCEKDERCFIPESKPNGTNPGYGVNNLYRGDDLLKIDKEHFMSIFESIPYLNGGLFERLDTKGNYFDGFSKEPDRRAVVPDVLFFGKEESGHIGLLTLFEKYVFTVEENTPLEQSVSLDPELLGRVFENLLGAYNPETDTTARKASGSYYTPREIVEYMVNESLVQHIIKYGVAESTVRDLLEYKETDTQNVGVEERTSIMEALYHIKVLDPACGSGAFPMGMLQQMVHILRQIDPDNSAWKEFLKRTAGEQADKAYRETDNQEERQLRLEQIEKAFNLRYANPDYARKLFIIQNCIYGVDIQPIAMQISKLRFFISLICEQNNGNILPLPNLETKFVCANTLIGIEKSSGVLIAYELEEKKKELLEVRKQHFYARTSKEKRKYRQLDEILRTELETMIDDVEWFGTGQAKQLTAWNPYDQNASSPFFDSEWMFGVKDMFDVVIGNPPYIDSESMVNQGLEGERRILQKRFANLSGNWDIYMAFFELSLSLGRIVTFITPDKWLSKPFGEKFREKQVRNRLAFITRAGNKVFENATVDAIITLFTPHANIIRSAQFVDKNTISLISSEDISRIAKPFLIDFLFSENASIINTIDSKTNKHILDIAECENACATSDFYIVKELIEEIENPDPIKFYRLINTGTIGKYCDKWSQKDISYGGKFSFPVVSRYSFNNTLGKSYTKRASRPKIIFKGLNLLDGCIDENAEILPGKSTIVICSENISLLKFLLGLLNSKLPIFYVKTKYSSSSYCGGITFSKDMINNFPIPPTIGASIQQRPIISLVDKILAAKKSNPQADTSAWEREIDLLVYRLYGLTYDEVLVVDPGTAVTREEYESK